MEDLDDRLRAAMQALDDRAPARAVDYDEDFAAKVEARLASEVRMENVTTDESGAADGVPPRIEDSGLHDIKALAKTTRQRVSRRITSQHDIDEQLLSSSSSGLHMVALPEPAKIVSLPSIDELAKAEPSIARAAGRVAAGAEGQPRRRPAVWIAGAVVAAAAAVVGVIVVKGGHKDEASTASPASAAGSGSAMAANGAAGTPAPQPRTVTTAQAATPPPPTGATSTGAAAVVGKEAEGEGGAGSGSASGSAAGSADSTTDVPVKTAPDTGKLDAHHAKGKTEVDKPKKSDASPINPKVKKNPNEPKSLDDLIDEAAGGSGEGGAKKPPAGDAKPALDKKELTPQDIRSAMGSVAKRAQACYDKFNQAGTVGVKASVAPSGSITKVTITGAFAGTPTGECVASVVQNVTFPAWDGAPMTVNYSYLLSE